MTAPEQAHLELGVQGMTCASCVARVERALQKQPGVVEASVNLGTEKASIEFSPTLISRERLAEAIREAGYQPVVLTVDADAQDEAKHAQERALSRDLLLGASFTLPLVLVAMLPMLIPSLMTEMHRLMSHRGWGAVQWALATPVQLWVGRRFLQSAWAEVRHASPGMNTLVALGSGSAYVYSVLALLLPGIFPAGTAHLYFEASAVIISLILLGKLLEGRAKAKGLTLHAALREAILEWARHAA